MKTNRKLNKWKKTSINTIKLRFVCSKDIILGGESFIKLCFKAAYYFIQTFLSLLAKKKGTRKFIFCQRRIKLKYNEFLSRNSPLSEICSLLNKFIYSANMIYKKNRWKRGHIQEKKRLKDVSLRVSYVPFITVFSNRSFFIWQRKQLLLLNFYNSSSIKAFRVSSAASSNFRLIDMVSPYIRHLSRHEDIARARFQINFETTYPASVVGVGMNYKTLAYWICMKSSVLKN